MFNEKIQNTIEIKTGDGETYFPMFKNYTKEMNFNTEEFDFVGVQGTFVAREQPQGNKYELELYFDNLQASTDVRLFEISARNKNVWIVNHPYYGRLTCQPLSLSFETYVNGMTKVTGTIWETIAISKPTSDINEKANSYIEKGYIYAESSFRVVPTVTSILKAHTFLDKIEEKFSQLKKTSEQAEDLKSKIRDVSGKINNMIEYPIEFFTSLQQLIEFPFVTIDSTLLKIYQLKRVLNDFIELLDLDMFEGTASCILAATLDISINGEYKKRNEIAKAINDIVSMFDSVNQIYEDNNIDLDPDLAFRLDYMKNLVIGSLYEVALNKEQERTMILDKDSSIVSLSTRFYGLSEESLARFIDENNLSIKELLMLKKGKQIYWFV